MRRVHHILWQFQEEIVSRQRQYILWIAEGILTFVPGWFIMKQEMEHSVFYLFTYTGDIYHENRSTALYSTQSHTDT